MAPSKRLPEGFPVLLSGGCMGASELILGKVEHVS